MPSNVTKGQYVRYTFRREGQLHTRPAIVTDVYETDKDANPDPARNPRAKQLVRAVAVALVVFDVGFAGGSIPVSQAFEDDMAPRPNEKGELVTPTEPMLGCWAELDWSGFMKGVLESPAMQPFLVEMEGALRGAVYRELDKAKAELKAELAAAAPAKKPAAKKKR